MRLDREIYPYLGEFLHACESGRGLTLNADGDELDKIPTAERTNLINRAVSVLIRENLGVVLSVIAVLAMTARLTWVSHGDGLTLMALVAHQGLGGLVGTLFVIGLPIVAGWFTFFSAVDLGEAIREEAHWRAQALIVLVSAGLSLLTLPSAWMLPLVFLVAFQITYAVVARVVRVLCAKYGREGPWIFRKSGGYRPRVPAVLVLATLMAVIPVLIFSDSMWLPRERITIQGVVETGYVISGDGDFTHVIRESNRSSFIVKTSLISQRTYCPSPSGSRSLVTEWFWPNAEAYKC